MVSVVVIDVLDSVVNDLLDHTAQQSLRGRFFPHNTRTTNINLKKIYILY